MLYGFTCVKTHLFSSFMNASSLKELQLQHPKQYTPPTSHVICGICVKFSLKTIFSPHFSEIPKTETNFEERLILKAFLLKFMNAYAPIFYVAFFKGR